MHHTEEAREKEGQGTKKVTFMSLGDTQKQVKLPLVRKQGAGEGTKNMAVRNSANSLTSWWPGHCVVNTEKRICVFLDASVPVIFSCCVEDSKCSFFLTYKSQD